MSDRPGEPPVLDIRGLRVSLGSGRDRREVLHGVDFAMHRCELVGIIGESGSGKTTLARTAVGLARPDAGTIRFGDADLDGSRHALRAFRRRGVLQYVFQDPLQALNPDRPIAWSVAEPLLVSGRPDAAAVSRALAMAQLSPELAGRLPGQLSGGQRQRALIARALVTNPAAIIADEPVSALDAGVRVQMLELFVTLAREHGIALAFISHDIGSVAGIADRIDVMFRGNIVESGTAARVIRRPAQDYTKLLIQSTPVLRPLRNSDERMM